MAPKRAVGKANPPPPPAPAPAPAPTAVPARLDAYQQADRVARKRIEMVLTSDYEEIPNAVAILLGQNQHTNTPRPSDNSAAEGKNDGQFSTSSTAGRPPGISEFDAKAVIFHVHILFQKLEEIAADGNPLAFLALAQLLSESFAAHAAAEDEWLVAFTPDPDGEEISNSNDRNKENEKQDTELLLSLERLFRSVFVNRCLREPTLADIDAAACIPQQKLCSFMCETANCVAIGELLVVVGSVCSINPIKDRCGSMFLSAVRDALIQHTLSVVGGGGGVVGRGVPLFSFTSLRALGTILIHLINGSKENKTRLPSWAFVCDAMGASSDVFFQIQCVEILFRLARPDPRMIDEWRHRCTNDRVRSVVLYRLRQILPTPAEELFKAMAEIVEIFNLEGVPKRDQTLVALPANSITLGAEENVINEIYKVYFTPNSFTILLKGPSADNITVPYTCIRSVKIARDNCFAFKLNLAPPRVREHVLVDTPGHECIMIEVNATSAKTFKSSPVQRWIMDALERRKHMSTASKRQREVKDQSKEDRRHEQQRESQLQQHDNNNAQQLDKSDVNGPLKSVPERKELTTANKKAETKGAVHEMAELEVAGKLAQEKKKKVGQSHKDSANGDLEGGETHDDSSLTLSSTRKGGNKKQSAAKKTGATSTHLPQATDLLSSEQKRRAHDEDDDYEAEVHPEGQNAENNTLLRNVDEDIDTDPRIREAVREFARSASRGGVVADQPTPIPSPRAHNNEKNNSVGDQHVSCTLAVANASANGSSLQATGDGEMPGVGLRGSAVTSNPSVSSASAPALIPLRPTPQSTAVRLKYSETPVHTRSDDVFPSLSSDVKSTKGGNSDRNEKPLDFDALDTTSDALTKPSDVSPMPPMSTHMNIKRRMAAAVGNDDTIATKDADQTRKEATNRTSSNSFMEAATAAARMRGPKDTPSSTREEVSSSRGVKLIEMVPSPEPGLKQFGSGSPFTALPTIGSKRAREEDDDFEDEKYNQEEGNKWTNNASQPPSVNSSRIMEKSEQLELSPLGEEDDDEAALPKSRIARRIEAESSVFSRRSKVGDDIKGSGKVRGVLRAVLTEEEGDDDNHDFQNRGEGAGGGRPRLSDRISENNPDDDNDGADENNKTYRGVEKQKEVVSLSSSASTKLPETRRGDNKRDENTDPLGTALAALMRMTQQQQRPSVYTEDRRGGKRGRERIQDEGRLEENEVGVVSLPELVEELRSVVISKVHRLRNEATEVITNCVGSIQLSVNRTRKENSERVKTFNAMVREGIDAALQAEADIASRVEATLEELNEELVALRHEANTEIKDQLAFAELEARQAVNVAQEVNRQQLFSVKQKVDSSLSAMTEAIHLAFRTNEEDGERGTRSRVEGKGQGVVGTNPMENLKRFLSQKLEEQMEGPHHCSVKKQLGGSNTITF